MQDFYQTGHGSEGLVSVVEIINLQKEVFVFHSGGLFLTNDDSELNTIVNRHAFL
jgi:hypothetical protein